MKRKREEEMIRKGEQRKPKASKQSKGDSPGRLIPNLPEEIVDLIQQLRLEGPPQEHGIQKMSP